MTAAALFFVTGPVLEACLFTLSPPAARSALLGIFDLSFPYFYWTGGRPLATLILTGWELEDSTYCWPASYLAGLAALPLVVGCFGIYGLFFVLDPDDCGCG